MSVIIISAISAIVSAFFVWAFFTKSGKHFMDSSDPAESGECWLSND